jgi:hypothetical protein
MRYVLALMMYVLLGGGGQFRAAPVMAQEPVLETYILGQGGSLTLNLEGLTARVQDEGFGGFPGLGVAKALIRFATGAEHSRLVLRVYREIPPDTIAFALLVNRVKVRAFDSQGKRVYARTLPGFVFGDGASGNWSRTLSQLPAQVARLHITFFGNYE